jgi:hypothetical protein
MINYYLVRFVEVKQNIAKVIGLAKNIGLNVQNVVARLL